MKRRRTHPTRRTTTAKRRRLRRASLTATLTLLLAGLGMPASPAMAQTANSPLINGRSRATQANLACKQAAESHARALGLHDQWRGGLVWARCTPDARPALFVRSQTPSRVEVDVVSGAATRVVVHTPDAALVVHPWAPLVSGEGSDPEAIARSATGMPDEAVVTTIQRPLPRQPGDVQVTFEHQHESLPVISDVRRVTLHSGTKVLRELVWRPFHQPEKPQRLLGRAEMRAAAGQMADQLDPQSLSCCRAPNDVTVAQRLGRTPIDAAVRCQLSPGDIAYVPVDAERAVLARSFRCAPECQVRDTWRSCQPSEAVETWLSYGDGLTLTPAPAPERKLPHTWTQVAKTALHERAEALSDHLSFETIASGPLAPRQVGDRWVVHARAMLPVGVRHLTQTP